jgi:hypothetical protein
MSVTASEIGTGLDLIGRKRDGRPKPIACCPRCVEPTPLIGTIAFYRAEFYCLDCGGHFGFLSPRTGEPTPELEARLASYEAEWDEHAGAKLSPEGHEPDDEGKLAAHHAALAWLGEGIAA